MRAPILASMKTRAERQGDHYKIFGQKIYITWGDHDATDNIIHLVLARLPDAPAGSKGISLFLCPSTLVTDDGPRGAQRRVPGIPSTSLGFTAALPASWPLAITAGRRAIWWEEHNGLGLHVHHDE